MTFLLEGPPARGGGCVLLQPQLLRVHGQQVLLQVVAALRSVRTEGAGEAALSAALEALVAQHTLSPVVALAAARAVVRVGTLAAPAPRRAPRRAPQPGHGAGHQQEVRHACTSATQSQSVNKNNNNKISNYSQLKRERQVI